MCEESPPPVFDAHSDMPLAVASEATGETFSADWIPGMRQGGITARVAALFVPDAYLPEMALQHALETLTRFNAAVTESDAATIATTGADLAGALDDEQVTLVLSLEGAEPIGGRPELVDVFFDLGVRLLTLTHSRRNAVASGVGAEASTPSGLSTVGETIVDRATRKGIALDVSHLNEPGFWDVVDRTSVPLIASHSNCRSVTDHPRNLDDAQIQAIADTGGCVGITAVGPFVDADAPTIGRLIDHVEYAVDLVGVEHVVFGFDFFKYLAPVLGPPDATALQELPAVRGLRHDPDVATLHTHLADRGFTRSEIAALSGRNLQRVLQAVLP